MLKMLLEFFHSERGYIDIGTGSLMFQMAIAGFVGGLFFVKVKWKWIVNKIKSLGGKKGKRR